MPIPIISNFSVNTPQPIDTRIISTGSNAMNNMLYKYEGLTTYRTDLSTNYTWNGVSWLPSSNGIYGGNGTLANSETLASFDTVDVTVNSSSKSLLFRAYSINDDYCVDIKNSFQRHTQDSADKTLQYKSQLIFTDGVVPEVLNGPYIIYNPKEQNSHGIGGISFGTFRDSVDVVYERMRIEGNGIIRFKPQSSTDETTKSLNIGIDASGTKPFLGYNWNGSSAESVSTDLSSYIEFNDSTISINHYNGTSATSSVTFTRGQSNFNGGIQVTGGTISTNRSISFGAFDNGVHFITCLNYGIKVDTSSSRQYAALMTPSSQGPKEIIRWGMISLVPTLTCVVPTVFTFSTTNVNLFASTIRSEYKSQMWDNLFNPDLGINAGGGLKNADKFNDLSFKSTNAGTAENVKNASSNGIVADAGNIFVKLVGFPNFPDTDIRTTGEFAIMIGSGYVSNVSDTTNEGLVSKSTFYVKARDYDRIYYFYLDGFAYQIQHQVRWFLGEPPNGIIDVNAIDSVYNWVQIGNIETGNKNNYAIGSPSYGATNYMSRFYSQTVFVPAGMAFKIQFRFHVSYNLATATTDANSPRVFINVIRSGKFRALGAVSPSNPRTPLVNSGGVGLGYPGPASAGGDPPVGG